MQAWIITIRTDKNIYDYAYKIDEVMSDLGEFEQSQRRAGKVMHCKIGDIVYIYIPKPEYEIRYKCIITELNKESCSSIYGEYVYNPYNYEEIGPYMTLKKVKEYKRGKFTYSYLKKEGFVK